MCSFFKKYVPKIYHLLFSFYSKFLGLILTIIKKWIKNIICPLKKKEKKLNDQNPKGRSIELYKVGYEEQLPVSMRYKWEISQDIRVKNITKLVAK